MGRVPLGAEGRTVKATLRITPHEEAYLVGAHGSVGKGLRALLDADLAPAAGRQVVVDELARVLDVPVDVLGEPGAAHPMLDDGLSEQDIAVALALDKVAQSLPVTDGDRPIVPVHRHKRGAPADTWWEGGVKMNTYSCTQPGCDAVLR